MSESETYMVLFDAMDGNLRMSERHRRLKLYAHELAEKIRNDADRRYQDNEISFAALMAAHDAADLIDPEVN